MTPQRIVIIGGVAGGMSAAARARRLDDTAQITVFEQGPYVSYANCGLPYHVSGEIDSRDSLLLHTPESLRSTLNLDVRVNHTATGIDPQARTVNIAGPQGDEVFAYDALVLSPGASAFVPDVPGIHLPQVSTLRTVDDAVAVAERAAHARAAVVLGAGFIGVEAAEALRHRGLEVALVELAPQVLPPMMTSMSWRVEQHMRSHGVDVRTGVSATAIQTLGTKVEVVLSDGHRLVADLVIAAMGVRPRSELARDAGLHVDERGAITVDDYQRTSDPHIWAVGDATTVRHAVTGMIGPVPLAGPANRQGRRAADDILGVALPATPVLGTAIVRAFDLTAATTGASPRQLDQAGIDYEVVHLHPLHHAGYFPGAAQLHLSVAFGRDGAVLGAQAVGAEGVDKRIDVLATAIRAGMSAHDLAELELAYAPPYGSAKDPINMAGFIMSNILDGTLTQWHSSDLEWARTHALILDVRSAIEFERGHLPEAINIPHMDIRERIGDITELARGRPVRVHCQSGMRSYLAHRVLTQHGIDSANFAGGMLTMRAELPDVPLVAGALTPA